jgi:glycosyltransferase involved in cell wall biosynthesis
MKIAVVAPTSLPARRANTVQVMKMTQALAEIGHQVRLAVPGEPPASQAWPILAHHYGLGREFPVEWLPAHPRLRSYDFGVRAVRWARRWKADLLFTRHPQTAALGSLLGIPTLLEVHDLPKGRFGPILLRRFLAGRGARRLALITHALAQDLRTRYPIPEAADFIRIAPDGVDLDRFAGLPDPRPARQALSRKGLSLPVSPESFIAGYTGHLYQGRGTELLLDLAARLPEMTFLCVGGEPDDVIRVHDWISALGLANVVLTGFVPNAELPTYQAACDVLLAPYQRRVAASSGGDIARYLSPLKVFEYLACGRAILCSDLPVLREVLHDGNALLLPPEDAGAWMAALEGLRRDPARRAALGAQARQDVTQYTWQARAARVLEGL